MDISAVHRAPNGEVWIDFDQCIGCGNCERNCPYGVIQMASPSANGRPSLLAWLLLGFGAEPGSKQPAAKGDEHASEEAGSDAFAVEEPGGDGDEEGGEVCDEGRVGDSGELKRPMPDGKIGGKEEAEIGSGGTYLTAIDYKTRKITWRHPYYSDGGGGGGLLATAGGLVFIAAAKDEMFRAFDRRTGKLLWQTKLPAGGYATPCTYMVGGKQYVVIAAGGGGKPRTKSGDAFVAFALP